jgi:hypothetical protein
VINKVFMVAALVLANLGAADPQVKLGAKTSAYGNGRWAWTVYIGGSPDSLATVRCVHYILDAKFQEPDRRVCQAGRSPIAFPTSGIATGWFPVKATVEWANGSTTEVSYEVRPPKI